MQDDGVKRGASATVFQRVAAVRGGSVQVKRALATPAAQRLPLRDENRFHGREF